MIKLPEPAVHGLHAYTESQMRQAISDATESQAAEIERLQHEVVNRNKRAMDGDEAKAAFNSVYAKAEALRAEIERLRLDAARYRFLADVNNWDISVQLISNIDFTEAEFDDAVDDAMKETKHDQ